MNGLDRILEQIKKDSAAAVNKINEEAERTALMQRQETEKQTEKEIEAIKQKAKAECDDIIKRAKSSAELAKKQTMLNAKQTIICSTIEKAHNKLLSLPDDEYFSVIEEMIKKNAHDNEKGEISFNEKDRARLPKGFKLKLLAVSGGNLSVSNKNSKIDGGFVLIYGGIEENCSFSAIFSEKHDELQDEVCSTLFS